MEVHYSASSLRFLKILNKTFRTLKVRDSDIVHVRMIFCFSNNYLTYLDLDIHDKDRAVLSIHSTVEILKLSEEVPQRVLRLVANVSKIFSKPVRALNATGETALLFLSTARNRVLSMASPIRLSIAPLSIVYNIAKFKFRIKVGTTSSS